MLVRFALRERHGTTLCDCGAVEMHWTEGVWHEVGVMCVISNADVIMKSGAEGADNFFNH